MRLHSGAILMVIGCTLLLSRVPRGVLAESSMGKELFERRCTGCHALDGGKVGPRLRGVYGRAAGSDPSFPYSESIRKSGVKWDSNSLDKWLTDPDLFIPDNDMAFRVPNADERAAIIGYLKELARKK
jgi:cytochrome c